MTSGEVHRIDHGIEVAHRLENDLAALLVRMDMVAKSTEPESSDAIDNSQTLQGDLNDMRRSAVGALSTVRELREWLAGRTVPQPNEGRREGQGARLLYVEDHAVNVDLMKRLLVERPEVELMVAETGAEGVEAALAARPGLVLLDWNLPDCDGAQFVDRLRSAMGDCMPPIVVLTADISKSTLETLKEVTVDGFVTKPYDLDEMLAIIDAALPREGQASNPGELTDRIGPEHR